jgi:hypothetical protein
VHHTNALHLRGAFNDQDKTTGVEQFVGRTSSIVSNYNPTFKERFSFAGMQPNDRNIALKLDLYDVSGNSGDLGRIDSRLPPSACFLGSAQLCLGRVLSSRFQREKSHVSAIVGNAKVMATFFCLLFESFRALPTVNLMSLRIIFATASC